jgi:hypothetical protein
MMYRWLALAGLVLVVGCKKTAPVEDKLAKGSGSASSSEAPAIDAAVAVPAWKVESQPVDLPCGDKPLALPAPVAGKPAADRVLAHAEAMTVCQDQVSVAAACTCLAGSIDKWGAGLSAPAECEPEKPSDPRAQLVVVSSNPTDPSSKSGGEAHVLVARHGAAWSAIGVIETAPDVDLSETPKASHTAKITRFESHPLGDAALYWVESRNQAQEKSMGDLEYNGAAQATICVVPNAATAAGFCYAPIKLGAWEYAFTIAKADQADACSIRTAATFSAVLEASAVTVRLLHGTDSETTAGLYRL